MHQLGRFASHPRREKERAVNKGVGEFETARNPRAPYYAERCTFMRPSGSPKGDNVPQRDLSAHCDERDASEFRWIRLRRRRNWGATGQSHSTTTARSVDPKFRLSHHSTAPPPAHAARTIFGHCLCCRYVREANQCCRRASRLLRLNPDRGRVKRVARAGIAGIDPEPRAPFVIGARFGGFSPSDFLHDSSNVCRGSTSRSAATAFVLSEALAMV